MVIRVVLAACGLAGAAVVAGRDGPAPHRARSGGEHAVAGGVADLTVCIIGGDNGADFKEYTTSGGISGYAMGTTAQNSGDVLLSWRNDGEFADQHPVIAQNLYRLRDGRFEQIGMSWLKHGFCASDLTSCGACTPENTCNWLGLGCADTYTAAINGDFTGFLGPRSEVNPVTGAFVVPHSMPDGANPGRLQVAIADVAPAQNPGAVYFEEAQYITPDDAGTATAGNNSSWRQVVVGNLAGGVWNLSFTGPTITEEPAISAWREVDPEVMLENADVPGDGRFILATRVTENGDSSWHYEYALLNMNSHRAARSFSVPLGAGAATWDMGFHDVFYHSGEVYDGTDWLSSAGGGSLTWATVGWDPAADTDNALRWSTLYGFRFDSDGPPGAASATIGLYRPGAPAEVTVATLAPGAPCPWDLDGDGQVAITDLLEVLAAWGDPYSITDLIALLAAWGPC